MKAQKVRYLVSYKDVRGKVRNIRIREEKLKRLQADKNITILFVEDKNE